MTNRWPHKLVQLGEVDFPRNDSIMLQARRYITKRPRRDQSSGFKAKVAVAAIKDGNTLI